MAVWALAADRPCAEQRVLACAGPSLALAVIGTPVLALLTFAILRAAGARSALMGILALVVSGWILVSMAEVVEPPPAVWPLLIGGTAAGYVVLEPARREA